MRENAGLAWLNVGLTSSTTCSVSVTSSSSTTRAASATGVILARQQGALPPKFTLQHGCCRPKVSDGDRICSPSEALWIAAAQYR